MNTVKTSNSANYVITYYPITSYSYTTSASTEEPEKMYLSGDFKVNGRKIYMKEVMYNNPATIVFWNDGTKTVAKCHAEDKYSKETGLAICILKRLAGNTKVRNIFNEWIQDDKKVVTLKDVRAQLKNPKVDKRVPEQTTFEDLSNVCTAPKTENTTVKTILKNSKKTKAK